MQLFVIAVQHDHAADNLDHLAARRRAQLFRRVLHGVGAGIQMHLELEQLLCVERVLELAHDGVGHALLADLEQRLQAVRLGAERGSLFSCHKALRFRYL